MKGKNFVKIAVIVLIIAAVVGVIVFFAGRKPTKEVTVVPVMNVYTTYWGDTKTLDGYVTAGSLQEVYMSEGGFNKVAVKEGDHVRKGDVLVEYDNTQAELMLRGDLAKINLLKSQIAAFEKKNNDNYLNIFKLEKILDGKPDKPSTGGTDTPPVTTPVLTAQTTIQDLTAAAVNLDEKDVGTQKVPYRILCTKDAVRDQTPEKGRSEPP